MEEENIKTFLQATNKTKGLLNLFDDKGEKAFRQFDDFGTVLLGLARLSKVLEKTTGVQEFSPKVTKKASREKIKSSGARENRSKIKKGEDTRPIYTKKNAECIYANAGETMEEKEEAERIYDCLLYTSPSPRDS